MPLQSPEYERISADPYSLPAYAREKLIGANYGLVGKHSAVQVCLWTKKSLRNKGDCYKAHFYGIDSLGCCQMSPSTLWCELNCQHCWRPMEFMKSIEIDPGKVDSPHEIISKTVEERKKLIVGFKGDPKTDLVRFKHAHSEFPCHWAISLSGEPTLYPKLPELVKLLKDDPRVKTVFIVSNGQEPGMLERLRDQKSLPTQLYVSMIAGNSELFHKLARPVLKDSWERFVQTLGLLPSLPCRKVIRLTVLKGINDSEQFAMEFCELFELSKPDFVEVKSYMFLGSSRARLKQENMGFYEDTAQFAELLCRLNPSYSFSSSSRISRIVLLKRKDSKWENRIEGIEG